MVSEEVTLHYCFLPAFNFGGRPDHIFKLLKVTGYFDKRTYSFTIAEKISSNVMPLLFFTVTWNAATLMLAEVTAGMEMKSLASLSLESSTSSSLTKKQTSSRPFPIKYESFGNAGCNCESQNERFRCAQELSSYPDSLGRRPSWVCEKRGGLVRILVRFVPSGGQDTLGILRHAALEVLIFRVRIV